MSKKDIASLVDDRPEDGVFRLHRSVFSDPEIFELEMKYIFERNWVFLGLDSQVRNPHDYMTTTVGRHPVVVMRDGEGNLNAFINSCPHKGARLCHLAQGNRKIHVCQYHSWSFDSAGRIRGLKFKDDGQYSPAFDDDSHDLAALPRFEVYRGFMFGALSADVLPLSEYLGEARTFIDIAVDTSPQGLELVPGVVGFTFEGNWKLQLENCSDQYHFTSTHPSYLKVLDRRAEKGWEGTVRANVRGRGGRKAMQFPADGLEHIAGGSTSFEHGHNLNWNRRTVNDSHPLFERAEELKEQFGEARRDWMFNTRNLTLFPNVQVAENASSQLRIIRPISVDKTEMLTYCIAPVGESAAARAQRIRQYEDFFNPSGLATPDDTINYEDCQDGHLNPVAPWLQGHARGMMLASPDGDPFIDRLGVKALSSVIGGVELGDETIFHTYYRSWRALLQAGQRADEAAARGQPAPAPARLVETVR
ncbi:aromatic ring-hydroxylating oxygenase subunit alpha [Pigmentiphaga kullae]|uniref:Benzoate 1,2-dioxygenase alpha subunit n=1 Tax=Pigmentiphaga kullae TaxID=151784 RepID=A0A4Q7N6L9_9BURK|nr:Rieske 2Fe-2S domain-containing protein [Pigmentiphaga kullae]RZS76968.1 benzoate 1,2-dioxygenase alpha subunit [Pigmentiphaga kullae]